MPISSATIPADGPECKRSGAPPCRVVREFLVVQAARLRFPVVHYNTFSTTHCRLRLRNVVL